MPDFIASGARLVELSIEMNSQEWCGVGNLRCQQDWTIQLMLRFNLTWVKNLLWNFFIMFPSEWEFYQKNYEIIFLSKLISLFLNKTFAFPGSWWKLFIYEIISKMHLKSHWTGESYWESTAWSPIPRESPTRSSWSQAVWTQPYLIVVPI